MSEATLFFEKMHKVFKNKAQGCSTPLRNKGEIIIDSRIGEIIIRDLKIDARRVQNSALRNLCLKSCDAIIQMLAFDMIECSRLIAQNNSNFVIKRGDIHMGQIQNWSSLRRTELLF